MKKSELKKLIKEEIGSLSYQRAQMKYWDDMNRGEDENWEIIYYENGEQKTQGGFKSEYNAERYADRYNLQDWSLHQIND